MCGYYKDVTPKVVIPPEMRHRQKAGRKNKRGLKKKFGGR